LQKPGKFFIGATMVIPRSNELLMSFDANGTMTQQIGGVTVDASKLTGLITKPSPAKILTSLPRALKSAGPVICDCFF